MENILTKKSFLDTLIKVLFVVGVISLGVSIIMFGAYNWDSLGKLEKFAIAQGAFLAPLIISFFLNSKFIQNILLFVSSILIGANLALIGQIYQTGADTWQLFALWAALSSLFALLLKTNLHLLLVAILIEFTLYLYADIYWWHRHSIIYLHLMLFIVNGIFWMVSIYFNNNFLSKLFSLATTIFATLFIIGSTIEHLWAISLIYPIFFALVWYFYRVSSLNLYYIELLALSLVVSFLIILAYYLFRHAHSDFDVISRSIVFIGIIMTVTTIVYKFIKKLKVENEV